MSNDVEAFTCLMYGHDRERSINSVRSIMLKKMVGEDEQLTVKCKVDLSRLPPCRDNLVPHIWRVNYRLATYKQAEKENFGVQKLMILVRADRRQRRAFWSLCGPAAPAYPLLSLICWRKQTRKRTMEKRKRRS